MVWVTSNICISILKRPPYMVVKWVHAISSKPKIPLIGIENLIEDSEVLGSGFKGSEFLYFVKLVSSVELVGLVGWTEPIEQIKPIKPIKQITTDN